MYKLEITVQGLPPTTNEMRRWHWSRKMKEAKLWKRRVHAMVLINKSGYPAEPLKKARVTITRCSSGELDFDGIVSGGKLLLDGLVSAGVLVDDRMSVIGIPTYIHEKAAPSKGHVKIMVEEIE